MPAGTDSLNIPALTTGTLTAFQTADNAAVSEQDIVDSAITAPVRTLAGQQDVAVQVLDQPPVDMTAVIFGDLSADLAKRIDDAVINAAGTSGTITGIRSTTGILTSAYTDATPTVPEFYPSVAKASSKIGSNRFLPATAIVMHSRRWGWIVAALDTGNRPIVAPTAGSAMNPVAIANAANGEGPVGVIASLPVYLDANIPTTLTAGAGSSGTEDMLLVGRLEDAWLWESTPRFRVLPDVLSGTLTTRLQLFEYVAFTAARYPKSFCTVTDTGLADPGGYS